jgi:hypothetical protein
MTLSDFIAKINWRQIVVHFVACCFFIFAFTTLSYLYDTKIVDIVRQSNFNFDEAIKNKDVTALDFAYFAIWTSTSGTVGLLAAFLISLIISIKRRWFWVNSLIVLLTIYFLMWVTDFGWSYLRKYFWAPGQLFSNTTTEFIINGILLIAIGLIFFFANRTNQFIKQGK